MKDKLYMVLAFIGMIILCVAYVFNYEGDLQSSIFEPDSYYVPGHSNTAENAVLLYSQMTGARSVECPQTSLTSDGNTIYISTNNKYGVKCFFLTDKDINMGEWSINGIDACIQQSHINDASRLLGEFINTSGDYNSLTDTGYMIPTKEWSDSERKYIFIEDEPTVPVYTFVAPFDFKFENSNVSQTDARHDTIIIISNNGLCRITLEGVANWFCAGDVGRPRKIADGTEVTTVEWYEHINSEHNTIIGNTGNSSIRSGNAGDVIAYITPDTKISFEKFEGNSWTFLSISNFFHDLVSE